MLVAEPQEIFFTKLISEVHQYQQKKLYTCLALIDFWKVESSRDN